MQPRTGWQWCSTYQIGQQEASWNGRSIYEVSTSSPLFGNVIDKFSVVVIVYDRHLELEWAAVAATARLS